MRINELKDLGRDLAKFSYNFISHRILWLVVLTAVLFYILLARLFELQIILSEEFMRPPPRTAQVTRTVPAPRGTIYDRHGRPLAINKPTFVVKMDPSVSITNEALLELALLFERNNEDFVDSFPISLSREFTITGTTLEQIARREHRWKDDMAVPNPEYATAEETWDYLRNRRILNWPEIDPKFNDEDARRIMNFRSQIFMYRLLDWNNYSPTPIILAYDVSAATIAAIEEQNDIFTGLFIDIQTLREYPAGRYVSHMIGYLMPITAAQLEANEHLGYTEDDMFGRAGLELSMEHFLRGRPGQQTFDVNMQGRRISAPVHDIEPRPGDRIFLTIDLELQKQAFYVLEYHLSQAVIARITRGHRNDPRLSLETVFTSFVNAHNLDIISIIEAEPDNPAYAMRRYISDRYMGEGAPSTTRASIERSRGIVLEGLQSRRITPAQMLITLVGTGQISDPDGSVIETLTRNPNRALDILVQAIERRELTPQLLNIDPATGSLIMLCTHTSEVLAAVTYPTFDNNRLVNNFDNDYFHHINVLDPTHPMQNRPFRETRAPGSTFKMFTAVAGLEYGVIGPQSRISTRASFDIGGSGVRCWAGGHGSINVAQAIAVSCNFFFADVAFRLGNSRSGGTAQGITRMNRYMEFFGLNDFSGVEIGEHPIELRNMGFMGNTMASPDFKRFQYETLRPTSPESSRNWFDGDTSQISIGQGFNNYTAAQMARGMNIIANRGVDIPLHLVKVVEDYRGNTVKRNPQAPAQTDINVSDATWDVVIEGMRLVTEPGQGVRGTAVNLFRNFPIRVGSKTGTAEQVQGRLPHSSFGVFAPLEEPEITMYVVIPFGATPQHSQISARIAQDMIGIALGLHHEPERPRAINTLGL